MAAIIKLEDGRALMRSSGSIQGTALLISRYVSPNRPHLKGWLADLIERCSPFIDFDVRGFGEHDREEFWLAAERALSALKAEFGAGFLEQGNVYVAESLNRLLEMHACQLRGDPPLQFSDFEEVLPFRGRTIDLSERWGSNADA